MSRISRNLITLHAREIAKRLLSQYRQKTSQEANRFIPRGGNEQQTEPELSDTRKLLWRAAQRKDLQ